jgi:hypothetical protein
VDIFPPPVIVFEINLTGMCHFPKSFYFSSNFHTFFRGPYERHINKRSQHDQFKEKTTPKLDEK